MIWTAKECAEYLKFAPKYFRSTVRYWAGFPQPLDWSIGGRPKWSAQAVKDWALRQNYAKAA
jgi:hypothetical protein